MKKILLPLLYGLSSLALLAQSPSPPNETIDWPQVYQPSQAKFYVHNEIEIQASPEIVWAILIDALAWPSWYQGAKNLSYAQTKDSSLQANSVFYWRTMGLDFESSIKAFEPHRFLAWESKRKSIQGYHIWLIIPTEQGCKVITDEAQNGWLTFFEKTFQPKKLQRLHDLWLACLKEKAETQYKASQNLKH